MMRRTLGIVALTMILAVAASPGAAAADNGVATRLDILVGFPADGQAKGGVELTTGTVIVLGDEGAPRHDDPVVERALAFARTVNKLWETFRLDPDRQKKFVRTFVARERSPYLVDEIPETDVGVTATLLETTPETAIYRVVFTQGDEELADSTVSVDRGGRAVVGAMDGVLAPYVFVIVEPVPSGDQRSTPVKFEMGGELSEPRAVTRANPVYPEDARADRVQGTVVLQVMIDEEGVVRDLAVLRSPDDRLTRAAAEAVREWRFQPATLADGTPVAVYYVLTIRFALE